MASKPIVQSFSDDLMAVIDKYREQGITVSEVVGAIELVKMNIILDQMEDDEEENIS